MVRSAYRSPVRVVKKGRAAAARRVAGTPPLDLRLFLTSNIGVTNTLKQRGADPYARRTRVAGPAAAFEEVRKLQKNTC